MTDETERTETQTTERTESTRSEPAPDPKENDPTRADTPADGPKDDD